MSSIDEIKSKIDIVDFVGEYVSLKKAGANFKGLCPFHNEKSPSFMVSREKQIWHCFGCQKGGDVFKFLMEKEGMDFGEALRALAKQAGVTLAYDDRQISGERTKLLAICDAAAKFYHDQLLKSPQARGARDYLKGRNLSAKTVVKFMLGYAPAGFDALIEHLLGQYKYRIEDIVAAGLALKRESRGQELAGREFYDRFRGRIMFPIRDVWGHVVGFTARVMPEDENKENIGGKYVNTPATLIYNKSAVFFGLEFARDAIKKEGKAVVVEGNMDVISSHQAGITNVVAASGTALASPQARLLKRFTNNIVLAFDADIAGEGAALRGIHEALREDMNVKIILLPEKDGLALAKDPDELINKSVDLWKKAIAEALPFPEYVYFKARQGKDMNKIEDKKLIAVGIASAVAKIADPVEQSYWINEMGRRLEVPEEVFSRAVSRMKKNGERLPPEAPEIAPKNRKGQLEERILAILVSAPEFMGSARSAIRPEHISAADLNTVYRTLLIWYNNDAEANFPKNELKERIKGIGGNPVILDVLLMLADNEFVSMTMSDKERELQKCAHELKELNRRGARKLLVEELRTAEKAKDQSRILELTKQLNELI